MRRSPPWPSETVWRPGNKKEKEREGWRDGGMEEEEVEEVEEEEEVEEMSPEPP